MSETSTNLKKELTGIKRKLEEYQTNRMTLSNTILTTNTPNFNVPNNANDSFPLLLQFAKKKSNPHNILKSMELLSYSKATPEKGSDEGFANKKEIESECPNAEKKTPMKIEEDVAEVIQKAPVVNKRNENSKPNKNQLLMKQPIHTASIDGDIVMIDDDLNGKEESPEISEDFLNEILDLHNDENAINENVLQKSPEETKQKQNDEDSFLDETPFKPKKSIENVQVPYRRTDSLIEKARSMGDVQISLFDVDEEEKRMSETINLINDDEEMIFEPNDFTENVQPIQNPRKKESEVISIDEDDLNEVVTRMEQEEAERNEEIKELEISDDEKEIIQFKNDVTFNYMCEKDLKWIKTVKEYLLFKINILEGILRKMVENGEENDKDRMVEKKNGFMEEMRKLELIEKKQLFKQDIHINSPMEEDHYNCDNEISEINPIEHEKKSYIEDLDNEEKIKSIMIVQQNEVSNELKVPYRETNEGGKFYVWKLADFLKTNPGSRRRHVEKKDTRPNAPKKFSGIDSDWQNKQFTWKENIHKCNNTVFGNDSFRPSQEAVINCVLSRNNALVLMPTGGGKSLCYQLPSYYVRGITLVVSPLVSLIQDQVANLAETGMNAVAFYSGSQNEDTKIFYRESHCGEGGCSMKFVFVTPERITQSGSFKDALDRYYKNYNFGLIVIDEAHCVSQWGHDFRESYQKLSLFTQDYPGVPILMLTATATERVKNDILLSLGITEAVVFSQSFNRKNLTYSVRPKSRNVIDEIESLCKRKYKNQSGIVYCLSQKNTEEVAKELTKRGVKSKFYHAGMETKDRSSVQKEWCDGKFSVICATIAFGMGIDKPDVRFVIHHSLPKTLEGYYQESGRAGRDGEPADCILFYNYKDKYTYERFLNEDEKKGGDPAHIKTSRDNLNQVICYCENTVDCRRTMVLRYFGENFDPKLCNKTCDNCFNPSPTEVVDMTDLGRIAVELVKREKRITATMIIGIMKGTSAMGKKFGEGTVGFKSAKGKSDQIMEGFMKELCLGNVLSETLVTTTHGSISVYLKEGSRCADFLEGKIRIKVKCKKGSTQMVDLNGGVKLSDFQSNLMDKLNDLRDEIYEEVRKQPGKEQLLKHNLFDTRVLKKIAAVMPRNLKEFEQIAMKRLLKEKYAERFISVVNDFIKQQNEVQPNKTTTSISSVKRPNPAQNTWNGKSGKRDNDEDDMFADLDLDEFADDVVEIQDDENDSEEEEEKPKKRAKKTTKKGVKKSSKKTTKKTATKTTNGIQAML